MLTVSTCLLMSNATVTLRSGDLLWLKPVAMSLFILCSAVLAEWLLLKPCFVEICEILFGMYGSSEVRYVCMLCLCSCLCLVLELV